MRRAQLLVQVSVDLGDGRDLCLELLEAARYFFLIGEERKEVRGEKREREKRGHLNSDCFFCFVAIEKKTFFFLPFPWSFRRLFSTHRFFNVRISASLWPEGCWKSADRLQEEGVEGLPPPPPALGSLDDDIDVAFVAVAASPSVAVTVPCSSELCDPD